MHGGAAFVKFAKKRFGRRSRRNAVVRTKAIVRIPNPAFKFFRLGVKRAVSRDKRSKRIVLDLEPFTGPTRIGGTKRHFGHGEHFPQTRDHEGKHAVFLVCDLPFECRIDRPFSRDETQKAQPTKLGVGAVHKLRQLVSQKPEFGRCFKIDGS